MNTVSNTYKELWKPIEGYEGLYDVSNQGRVRSYHTTGRKGVNTLITDKGLMTTIVKPIAYTKGDRRVSLYKNGVHTQPAVSQLVMAAFSGPPDIYFIDGDKANLAVSNLRYGTRSESTLRGIMRRNIIASTVEA